MIKLYTLAALSALFAFGCANVSDDEVSFEQSPTAREAAAQTPGVQSPSAFGFPEEVLPAAQLPGFPTFYCPKSVVTRAQMASFVVRTMHGAREDYDVHDGKFTDVAATSVHAEEIARLTEDRISHGCNEGAFCPQNSVTRAQMATFTVRMMRGPDFEAPAASGLFVDLPPGDPHAPNVEFLANAGLIEGCGLGRYCPDDPVTREQIATFLVAAKYGEVPTVGGGADFHDVARDNPHRQAIEVLVRDGVTQGCSAPVIGYRLNGYPLSDRQRNWLMYFVGRWLPLLENAYGNPDRARQVGSRVIWWSLKRQVFGEFNDPFGHSVCHTADGSRFIGPFDSCEQGRLWEVGPSAVVVPQATEAEVQSALKALYPGLTAEEVAAETVDVGRSVSGVAGGTVYPEWAEERVINESYLMRSWLVRDPAIAAFTVIDDIERKCVNSWEMECTSVGNADGRHFGTTPESARAVQDEIERIIVDLGPR